MIYRNGKKYMLMKNGRPYQEAYSSIPPVQLKAIYKYFSSHRGETQLAENGNDLIFTFEPFPDDILSYLKYYPHAVELRLACRAGSQYDIW